MEKEEEEGRGREGLKEPCALGSLAGRGGVHTLGVEDIVLG